MQSGFRRVCSRADIKQQKTEIKELRQKVSRLERDCQNKDSQIDKKDRHWRLIFVTEKQTEFLKDS